MIETGKTKIIPFSGSRWMTCEPSEGFELVLRALTRRYQWGVKCIGDLLLTKDPTIHLYHGGVLHTESKEVTRGHIFDALSYLKDTQTPWTWWIQKDRQLEGLDNLKWLGFRPIDRMWHMSYNVKAMVPQERPSDWRLQITHSIKDIEDYSTIFSLSQGFTEPFTKKCLERFQANTSNYWTYYHVGYYQNKPVAIGTVDFFGSYGVLSNLGVHPEWAMQGFGKLMLEEMIITLGVFGRSSGLAFVPELLKPFFEKFGFISHAATDIYGNEKNTENLINIPDVTSFSPYKPEMILQYVPCNTLSAAFVPHIVRARQKMPFLKHAEIFIG